MLRFGIPMLDEVFTVGRVARAENKALEGRKLAEIAAERGCDVVDVMLDLAVSEDLETEFSLTNFLHVDPRGVTAILSDEHPRRRRRRRCTSRSSAARATPATCSRAGCEI